MEINKMIIPASGLGIKFLPFTKSITASMLPILNKPAIEYLVQEGIDSEINNFIIVAGKNKHQIQDYFESSYQYSDFIRDVDKKVCLNHIEQMVKSTKFAYVNQSDPFGIGHAILMTQNFVGKEYFAIALPEDIILSKCSVISQLIRIARQEKASVIAVQEIPVEQVSNHSVITIKKQLGTNLFQISSVVDKPVIKAAPSNLALIGRFVLSSKIFSCLEQMSSYAVNELSLIEAISLLMQNNERVIAYNINCAHYAINNPTEWIKCSIDAALHDSVYSGKMKEVLSHYSMKPTSVKSNDIIEKLK